MKLDKLKNRGKWILIWVVGMLIIFMITTFLRGLYFRDPLWITMFNSITSAALTFWCTRERYDDTIKD